MFRLITHFCKNACFIYVIEYDVYTSYIILLGIIKDNINWRFVSKFINFLIYAMKYPSSKIDRDKFGYNV